MRKTYSWTSKGTASIAHNMLGQRKVMNGCDGVMGAGSRRRSHVRGRSEPGAVPVGESAALFLQVGEAQDRIDKVVVGGEFERVDAGAREGLAQLGLAPFGRGLKALAKAGVMRVDDELLAGLGILQRHEAEVGQVHLERVEEAHGGHFMALRQLAERRFPPWRTDEIGDDEDRRAALDAALCRGKQDAQV